MSEPPRPTEAAEGLLQQEGYAAGNAQLSDAQPATNPGGDDLDVLGPPPRGGPTTELAPAPEQELADEAARAAQTRDTGQQLQVGEG